MNSRAYCSAFNFKGADQQKKVGVLSGGERNRVHLAKMLKSGANVLLLDEPTNDLDVDTLRALEEALEDFAGCAVIISHDRWFLDRIATHILAFEGDSHVEWFEGNFQDYEEDKKRRLGIDSTIPHRIKYKRDGHLGNERDPVAGGNHLHDGGKARGAERWQGRVPGQPAHAQRLVAQAVPFLEQQQALMGNAVQVGASAGRQRVAGRGDEEEAVVEQRLRRQFGVADGQ
jgi:ABC-type cobalamin/Fe3+-siderophores transport system ATPase subunit